MNLSKNKAPICPQTDEAVPYEIALKNGKIPVHKFGHGEQLLIVLHGFESNNQAFNSWKGILDSQYTLCLPDLPFHGQSLWKGSSFNQADIVELLLAIAKKEKKERFSVAGFSIGGRLIVCVGHQLKDKIDQFILLAPAGIGSYDKVRPLYQQNLLEWAFQWPAWFKWGVATFHRLGWVSSFRKRYAEVQIFPSDRRYRLFRVFNSILDFSTSRSTLINFWETTSIPILIVIGRKDRLIPNDKVRAYFAKAKNCTFIEIDAKHALETADVAKIVLNNSA